MRIREATADEVAFYEENGWVKLDGLVDRGDVDALLGASKELKARADESWNADRDSWGTWRLEESGYERDFGDWVGVYTSTGLYTSGRVRIDPLSSFTYSKELGRVLQQVINRERLTDEEVGVRYMDQSVPCLPPNESSRPHGYHQDGSFGMDIPGATVWIALDEVAPEQGAMRMLTRSHREGSLGKHAGGVLAHHPKLVDLYEWSPPFHYEPGDATIHHSYTIHGTPENVTDRPRWSYIASYVPADAAPVQSSADVEALEQRGSLVVYP
jgi:hypothetical protein